ncbi:MAG: methyltransferase domain-containing protein [Firmicutes bacterium]|nr:methyltransferase domain-containing protein [Bacillota bacterium]
MIWPTSALDPLERLEERLLQRLGEAVVKLVTPWVHARVAAAVARAVPRGAAVLVAQARPRGLARALARRLRGARIATDGLPLSPADCLPHPDASFDAAVAALSAGDWDDERARMHELFRVVRPGGFVFICDRNSAVLPDRPPLSPFGSWRAGQPFGRREAGDLLADAGFMELTFSQFLFRKFYLIRGRKPDLPDLPGFAAGRRD